MITYGHGKAMILSLGALERIFTNQDEPMTMVKGLLFLEKKGHDLIYPCFLMGTTENENGETDGYRLYVSGVNNVDGLTLYSEEMKTERYTKDWRLWNLPPKNECRERFSWRE